MVLLGATVRSHARRRLTRRLYSVLPSVSETGRAFAADSYAHFLAISACVRRIRKHVHRAGVEGIYQHAAGKEHCPGSSARSIEKRLPSSQACMIGCGAKTVDIIAIDPEEAPIWATSTTLDVGTCNFIERRISVRVQSALATCQPGGLEWSGSFKKS